MLTTKEIKKYCGKSFENLVEMILEKDADIEILRYDKEDLQAEISRLKKRLGEE